MMQKTMTKKKKNRKQTKKIKKGDSLLILYLRVFNSSYNFKYFCMCNGIMEKRNMERDDEGQ